MLVAKFSVGQMLYVWLTTIVLHVFVLMDTQAIQVTFS
jgi:hypothetical protein